MVKISGFIITKNEAIRISKAINSIKEIVDEIIVIDSGSTDETVAIFQELGAKVIFNEWQGYVKQKSFGESICRHDWILNIDADEEFTKELQQEIKEIFNSPGSDSNGFGLLSFNQSDIGSLDLNSDYSTDPISRGFISSENISTGSASSILNTSYSTCFNSPDADYNVSCSHKLSSSDSSSTRFNYTWFNLHKINSPEPDSSEPNSTELNSTNYYKYKAYDINFVILHRSDNKTRFLTPVNRFIRLYNRKFCSFANTTKTTTHDAVTFNSYIDIRDGEVNYSNEKSAEERALKEGVVMEKYIERNSAEEIDVKERNIKKRDAKKRNFKEKNNIIFKLKNPAYHRSGTSIEQLISKANFYSTEQAKDMISLNRKPSLIRITLEFPLCFLKAFLIRRYFVFGFDGFVDSMIFAFARFAIIAKTREFIISKNKNV